MSLSRNASTMPVNLKTNTRTQTSKTKTKTVEKLSLDTLRGQNTNWVLRMKYIL